MKEVMLSVKPRWCELIASGEKMIEVRKTKPRVELPFKCYIYCSDERSNPQIGGKVIGEFVCDEIKDAEDLTGAELFKLSCMDFEDWQKYTDGHKGKVWCWSITELRVYEHPKELSEFRSLKVKGTEHDHRRMRRPPQSYCFVEKYVEDVKADSKSPAQRRWEEMSWKELSAECARLHLSYGQAQVMAMNGTLPDGFGKKGNKDEREVS